MASIKSLNGEPLIIFFLSLMAFCQWKLEDVMAIQAPFLGGILRALVFSKKLGAQEVLLSEIKQ